MRRRKMIEKEFKEIINNIKKDIKTTQVKVAVQLNNNLIMLF